MRRLLPALVLGLILAPVVAQALAQPATPLKAGTYEVVNFSNAKTGGGEVLGLVKITPKDGGGVEGELLTAAANQRNLTLKNVAVDGGTLRMTLQRGAANLEFEGRVAGADADSIRGSFVAGDRVTAGRVTFTDKTEVASATVPPAEMQPLRQGLTKLGKAGQNKMEAAQVRDLANETLKAAQPYGQRYENELAIQIAEALATQHDHAAVAQEFLQRVTSAVKGMPESRLRVLNALAAAARTVGRDAEAETAEAEAAKLAADVVDREYLATTPPFKPKAFEGRKDPSERVAVMELFTGAQCPPCVAADVAFEGLEKTYLHHEVALIQYHLHIPGPDPMTNATTEARAKFYGARSTPSTFFNGKSQAGGGGAITASENKYNQYRGILNKLLEEQPKATVTLGASRQGDIVTVRAGVSKLEEPGEDKKLRFVLVEDTVRLIGSNRLRYHHLVVRAMPGGAEGLALLKEESQHTARVNITELRSELTKYLDDFNTRRAFPQPERPLAMKHLKAMAFVQDDKTKEILQAAIVDIGGERAGQ